MQRLKQLAHEQGRTVIATVHQVMKPHGMIKLLLSPLYAGWFSFPFKAVMAKLFLFVPDFFSLLSQSPLLMYVVIDMLTTPLLKPRASLYEIFDDLMIMSKGRLVYGGDAQAAFDVFAGNGIPCPPRVSVNTWWYICLESANAKLLLDMKRGRDRKE